MKVLKLYRKLKFEEKDIITAWKLLCYRSIDTYIENASDKEYEVISEVCINAYMKTDDICDLSRLADCVSEKYVKNKLSINDLQNLSKWDILGFME